MLKGETIICISWINWLNWENLPLVMHHMMTRLAKNNRVLFVDPPVAWSNLVIRPAVFKNHWKRTYAWFYGVRMVMENLFVYYPPPLLLQYGHLKAMDRLSQEYTAIAIKNVAKSLGFNSPILWIYHPYAISPRGQFKEKLTCYDCNDDVGFFYSQNFNKRKKLSAMEADLTKKADIVFATSKNLFKLRKSQNQNTHYLPSALNVEMFKSAILYDLKVAPELEAIPKPVIGFVGAIDNLKINWQWIREAAMLRQRWSFVFIGRCIDLPPSYIAEQKNIIFLGAKPQESLPAYLKGFDVCLIPYQGEDFLKACQPTKAFEYLAAGKPVVASWIHELEEYSNIVFLSRTIEEFVRNIESALVVGKKDEMIKLYIQTAYGYTWDDRVEKASAFVNKTLKDREMNQINK
ncbi:MAG TPA: glycosyltransferase [Candidatus Wujingus californicus]